MTIGPMLRYLGTGERHYQARPVRSYTRHMWEFQAVVRGSIAPTFGPGRPSPPATRRLWMFGPSCRHGWSGDGHSAEIIVFHFPAIPDPLPSIVGDDRWMSVALLTEDLPRLRITAERAQRALASSDATRPLRFQQVLTDVCLLALDRMDPEYLPARERSANEVCAAAEAWAAAQLESADVAGMAKAVGLSVAHLRRLFHDARQQTPQRSLMALRMSRAAELVLDHSMGLEAVAQACGLSSASALSRAFRSHFGLSPRDWLQRAPRRHNAGA